MVGLGRVGLGQKILRPGWVRLGRVQYQNLHTMIQETNYSTTLIHNDKKL